LSVLCLGTGNSSASDDPKIEAARAAAIEKVTRFFESIPKGGRKDGLMKCYRKGLTSEIILEITMPSGKEKEWHFNRERLFRLLGTYFIVQEIRDLSKHQATLTCIELDQAGKERARETVRFSEIIPFFNGHNF